MRPLQFFIILAIVYVCAAGCVPAEDRLTLAVVEKHVITTGEFKLKAKLYGLNAVTGKDAVEFLNLLINDSLVLNQAKKLDISFTQEELQPELESFAPDYDSKETKKALKDAGISYKSWLTDIEEKILRKKTILTVMKDKIKIDPAEVKDFYWSNIVDFRTQKKVRVRQIVSDSEEKAKQVQQHIMRGEPFEALAAKYSITSDSKNGGDLGYFAEGDMPAFISEVVFRMKKGSVSGIVKSPYGWHIFLCEDIREAETPGYEAVKQEVFNRYYDEKKDEYFKAWMEDLRKQIKITIYEKNVEKIVLTREDAK